MRRMRWKRWVREHGWIVPGSYVLAAVALGTALPKLDSDTHEFRFLAASAAEQLLAAIASGMIAFTGIVFSISLIVSQFWNTAYSMRLMQWLRNTRLTGHAFGIFTATFVYALVALTAVGSNEQSELSITVAFSLALLLASVLFFLLLLYNTLRQMNLSYVLALIGDHGRDVIDEFYGAPGEQSAGAGRARPRRPCTGVRTRRARGVASSSLLPSTSGASSSWQPRQRPRSRSASASVTPSRAGRVIAKMRGGAIPPGEIRRAFLLGSERTMEQDPKFALRLLADVAIKALSPAINDPTTAVQALDQIEDLLRRIGVRTIDIGRLVGVRGYVRVTYPAPTWDDLLALATDEIRIYGAGSIQVDAPPPPAVPEPRADGQPGAARGRSRIGYAGSTQRSSSRSIRPTAPTRGSPTRRGSGSPASGDRPPARRH